MTWTEQPLRHQRYAAAADLHRAQAALMRWVSRAGHCNYWHKGDIGHRLFNGCQAYDPADMFHLWLDGAGEIAAFATLFPHWEVFDLQLAPDRRFGAEHIALFDFCEGETLRLARSFGIGIETMTADVFDCDPEHAAFIQARGYQPGEVVLTLTRHRLATLPPADLPPGFRFHRATADDIERLSDVHNHSFSNKWSAETYGAVFRSPHLEYEFVVVAPDERFAAFTNVWVDAVNRSLLFEPVGAHEDFRRRGLAKALMVHVTRLMRCERGIERAYVCHERPDKNPAAAALYASVGFEKLHHVQAYAKPVAPA